MSNGVPWSAQYWNSRYAGGGISGIGSRGELAVFKAAVVNKFSDTHGVASIIEYGCGDGYQLGLFKVGSYLGFDVSQAAVERCRKQYADDQGKRFELAADYQGESAHLALSLDVIYHLVEDPVYEAYMAMLFGSAERYVIIYSSNVEGLRRRHERPRRFSDWIASNAADWRLINKIPNPFPYPFPYNPKTGHGSLADFYLYRAAKVVEG